jgi:hypothetical protein
MVSQVAQDPEGAKMLANAIRGLDWMASQKFIKKATARDYQKQLKEVFAADGAQGLTELAGRFGVPTSFLSGGSSGAAKVGFNPG